LDRIDDARAIVASLGEPRGDLLPLLCATTALYVDFCAGSTSLDDARAQALVNAATSIRGSWGLLALCAWRSQQVAERARLVVEERKRDRSADLERLMPKLWAWMSKAV